ncbi:MAG: manganese catalase family protein [Clostridia bacterium]|nr:manganese catalase family protein [Clostridia bacterium]
MWIYDRKLEYPVHIKKPDARAAHIIVSQLGGPDGELGASMRYLNQRYSMPYRDIAGVLTDVGKGVAGIAQKFFSACFGAEFAAFEMIKRHFSGRNFR